MKLDNKKIVIIVGPTASGKSELAVKTAKKIGGEIVSADSRQVYEGLDVGTAKVKGRWAKRKKGVFVYKGIVHHCIDFIPPQKIFSAGKFKKRAWASIKDILARGKTPIIVGGTGFWIDSVVYNLNLPEVAPNLKLRKVLEKKSSAKLYKMLKKIDPARAETIEKENPRRLVRAIEIARKIGRVPSLQKQKSSYSTEWIGLNPPLAELEKNISERANRMLNHGLLEETRQLMKNNISRKRIRELGFEYKNALNYLDGRITKKEMLARLIRDTLRYTKQQLRWFRRNKEIVWFKNPKLVSLSNYFTRSPSQR